VEATKRAANVSRRRSAARRAPSAAPSPGLRPRQPAAPAPAPRARAPTRLGNERRLVEAALALPLARQRDGHQHRARRHRRRALLEHERGRAARASAGRRPNLNRCTAITQRTRVKAGRHAPSQTQAAPTAQGRTAKLGGPENGPPRPPRRSEPARGNPSRSSMSSNVKKTEGRQRVQSGGCDARRCRPSTRRRADRGRAAPSVAAHTGQRAGKRRDRGAATAHPRTAMVQRARRGERSVFQRRAGVAAVPASRGAAAAHARRGSGAGQSKPVGQPQRAPGIRRRPRACSPRALEDGAEETRARWAGRGGAPHLELLELVGRLVEHLQLEVDAAEGPAARPRSSGARFGRPRGTAAIMRGWGRSCSRYARSRPGQQRQATGCTSAARSPCADGLAARRRPPPSASPSATDAGTKSRVGARRAGRRKCPTAAVASPRRPVPDDRARSSPRRSPLGLRRAARARRARARADPLESRWPRPNSRASHREGSRSAWMGRQRARAKRWTTVSGNRRARLLQAARRPRGLRTAASPRSPADSFLTTLAGPRALEARAHARRGGPTATERAEGEGGGGHQRHGTGGTAGMCAGYPAAIRSSCSVSRWQSMQ